VQWRWTLNNRLARGERCLVQDVVQRAGDLGVPVVSSPQKQRRRMLRLANPAQEDAREHAAATRPSPPLPPIGQQNPPGRLKLLVLRKKNRQNTIFWCDFAKKDRFFSCTFCDLVCIARCMAMRTGSRNINNRTAVKSDRSGKFTYYR
jgi:hypothetical protein